MSAPITLTGRLGADPEIRFGASGIAILKLRVVTSRPVQGSGDRQVGRRRYDVVERDCVPSDR